MGENGDKAKGSNEVAPSKYDHGRPSTNPAANNILDEAELVSQSASSHQVASHSPSPNSYEFALHGLLALGSTNETGIIPINSP